MNVGIQAAFKRFLDTFDPEQFERELNDSSKLDFLSGNRRGKYWEAFKKHYRKMAEVSDGEFQDLLRREISQAYEAQQQHKQQNRS